MTNKVAAVTGGASGIGEACARELARQGHIVAVLDRNLEGAERVASEIGGRAYGIDVGDEHDVERVVAAIESELGPVLALVNSAGLLQVPVRPAELAMSTFDEIVRVNQRGLYLCCVAFGHRMVARREGAIVNISSVNGLMGLGEEAYGAAKAGMVNLTQNTAIRYGEFNVRANCIAPGTVDTPIWNERKAVNPNVMQELAAWYPLGRVGQPDYIANAALFLVSDAASWITGVVLPVDGGLTAGLFRMAKDLSPEQE